MGKFENKFRPIVIFGYVLIILSIVGLSFFYWVSLQVDLKLSDMYFIISMAFWYFITGLGLPNGVIISLRYFYIFYSYVFLSELSFLTKP